MLQSKPSPWRHGDAGRIVDFRFIPKSAKDNGVCDAIECALPLVGQRHVGAVLADRHARRASRI